ncbi:hypothetical protein P7K49_022290 [Saguinus oedipus]|uniref:DH domain-containing protein n=1 Tax=Saguinus oedipus TaxID=9490 RepID=A0ABQ9UXH7_SAGOE|nr:hypothetical protein P7K49_022290 [Saguinus oedipus]
MAVTRAAPLDMRKHVAMTLLDTEQSYVESLRTLMQVEHRGEAQLRQGGEFRLRHEPGKPHGLDAHMAWGQMECGPEQKWALEVTIEDEFAQATWAEPMQGCTQKGVQDLWAEEARVLGEQGGGGQEGVVNPRTVPGGSSGMWEED